MGMIICYTNLFLCTDAAFSSAHYYGIYQLTSDNYNMNAFGYLPCSLLSADLSVSVLIYSHGCQCHKCTATDCKHDNVALHLS